MPWIQKLPSGAAAQWSNGATAKGDDTSNRCCRCGNHTMPCNCPAGYTVQFDDIQFACVNLVAGGFQSLSVAQIDTSYPFCLSRTSTVPCVNTYTHPYCHYVVTTYDAADCAGNVVYEGGGVTIYSQLEGNVFTIYAMTGAGAYYGCIFYATLTLTDCGATVVLTNSLGLGDLGDNIVLPSWAGGGGTYPIFGYGGTATVNPDGCASATTGIDVVDLDEECTYCPTGGTPQTIRVTWRDTQLNRDCHAYPGGQSFRLQGGDTEGYTKGVFDLEYIGSCQWQLVIDPYTADGFLHQAWGGADCSGPPNSSMGGRIIFDLYRKDCGEWELGISEVASFSASPQIGFGLLFAGRARTPTCTNEVELANEVVHTTDRTYEYAPGYFTWGLGRYGTCTLTFP